ncbi:MAG: hypothetical protein DWH98_02865 [Planctomycetota bacterium]|nr:MAG: hypothetical protein DWH98_02865 [Planctomycetota bacterium]
MKLPHPADQRIPARVAYFQFHVYRPACVQAVNDDLFCVMARRFAQIYQLHLCPHNHSHAFTAATLPWQAAEILARQGTGSHPIFAAFRAEKTRALLQGAWQTMLVGWL